MPQNLNQQRKFRRVHPDDAGFTPTDRHTAHADPERVKLALNILARKHASDEEITERADALGIKPASAMIAAVRRIQSAMSDEE